MRKTSANNKSDFGQVEVSSIIRATEVCESIVIVAFACLFLHMGGCSVKYPGPFETTYDVRQKCPLLPNLFDSVIDEIMENVFDLRNVYVESGSVENLRRQHCIEDLLCFFEFTEHAQRAVDELGKPVAPFGMCFSSLKIKTMLVISNFLLGMEELTIVYYFLPLGFCLTKVKAHGHLHYSSCVRCTNISPKFKSRVWAESLCNCET